MTFPEADARFNGRKKTSDNVIIDARGLFISRQCRMVSIRYFYSSPHMAGLSAGMDITHILPLLVLQTAVLSARHCILLCPLLSLWVCRIRPLSIEEGKSSCYVLDCLSRFCENLISIHSPHEGRDLREVCDAQLVFHISIHPPRAGRDVQTRMQT